MIGNYLSLELMNKIDFPYTLKIYEEVLDKLKELYNGDQRFEVGGVLLGKIDVKNGIVSIEKIEEIKSKEVFRLSYIRDNKIAQQVINKSWTDSKGIINYLGEWHTHPNVNPSPSSTDKTTIMAQTIEKNSKYFPYTILLIIGKSERITVTIANKGRIILCTHIR